ncbi:diguanylate cyclase [Massilia sp. B-10]|nr:diguanylate cyclase [Massilia sp. B-10]
MSLLILIQLWLGIRLYGQVALRDRLEKERRSLQKLLVKKSRSLRRQALKDALTGIANRRQFDTRLLREFNRAATEGLLSLVILDVDYFKKYNDQHGHPVGMMNASRRWLAASTMAAAAARIWPRAWAARNSPSCCPTPTCAAPSRWPNRCARPWPRVMEHISGMPHSVTVSCGVHAVVPSLNMAQA